MPKNEVRIDDIKENFFQTVISASSKSLNFKERQILSSIIKIKDRCNRLVM